MLEGSEDLVILAMNTTVMLELRAFMWTNISNICLGGKSFIETEVDPKLYKQTASVLLTDEPIGGKWWIMSKNRSAKDHSA